MLEEEEAPVRLQHPRNLGQRDLLAGHAAQDKRHNRGVEGGIREGQPLGRRIDDLRRPAERVNALAKAAAHVSVGLGQHQPRDRVRVVLEVESGAGPDLERRAFGGGQKRSPLVPHTGRFRPLVERVVQRRKHPPSYRHSGPRA